MKIANAGFSFQDVLKAWDELSKWQISIFFGTNIIHVSNQENGWKYSFYFFPSCMVATPSDSNDSDIFSVCLTMMILWWKCWHHPAPGKFYTAQKLVIPCVWLWKTAQGSQLHVLKVCLKITLNHHPELTRGIVTPLFVSGATNGIISKQWLWATPQLTILSFSLLHIFVWKCLLHFIMVKFWIFIHSQF